MENFLLWNLCIELWVNLECALFLRHLAVKTKLQRGETDSQLMKMALSLNIPITYWCWFAAASISAMI